EQFVYTFKIFIRPGDLLELNAPLGNLVLQSPAEATQIFQTIVHECMETFNPNHRRVSATQISLNLRLSSLPSFPFVNYIERVQDLSRAASHGGFVHLRGIVIGITALSKYT
ncbi:hypothetical protein ACJMK2_031438, partial [Sinanodonta woodiana]